MTHSFTPEQLLRIRKRHRGYGYLLAVISLVLLLQPLATDWPMLTSLGSITLAVVMMVFLTRFSPLQRRKRWLYGIGIAAIVIEVIWLVTLPAYPGLAKHLTIPHLLIWVLFIGFFLLRKVHALIIEPYVTLAVLMGAANGYLLIGYTGGFLLHTLLIWQPEAFEMSYLPAGLNPIIHPLRVFPSMLSASFEALTTVSNTVATPGYILSHFGILLITIIGQLYVAVLIALVLGRFHRRPQL